MRGYGQQIDLEKLGKGGRRFPKGCGVPHAPFDVQKQSADDLRCVFFGKTPVAVASIWQNDFRSRQDIAPYLAELYVLPRVWGVGLGTALQNFALDSARKLGLKSIYLITSHKNYYERNGWRFVGSAPLKNSVRKREYVHKL